MVKFFNYNRSIVIADVHWRFGDWREPLPLTFQHWSGVSPYTSPCGFAETCVFGKQSLGKLSLRAYASYRLPAISYRSKFLTEKRRKRCAESWSLLAGEAKAYCKRTPSFFAEFLNEGSLVHLGLLAQSTCVGFSTVSNAYTLEVFPGTLLFFLPRGTQNRE